MIKSTRIFGILVACILLSLNLTACNTKQQNDKPTLPTQDPFSQELISNPALSRSGALVVATRSVNGIYNPFQPATEAERWISELVFESMIKYDESGNLIEVLASSYNISEDGLTVDITLKEGVVFHDGSTLTAKDVVFTYDLAKALSFWQTELENVTSVEVIDDFNLTFKFSSNRYDKNGAMMIPILSSTTYSKVVDWQAFNTPVGTGMFKFDKLNPSENVVLTKNVTYWSQKANISGIVIREMSSSEAFEAFSEGRIDLFEVPPSKPTVNDIKALGFGNIMIRKSNVFTYIGFNMKSSIMSIPELRKALIYSLNRELFIQNEWHGYADTIDYLATGIGEFEKGTLGIKKYPYNIDIAKQLLDEAGLVDTDGDGIREFEGENFSISWNVIADVDWSYNLAETAIKEWRALGLDIRVVYNDFDSVIKMLNGENTHDMWNMAWQISGQKNPEIMFGSREKMGVFNFGNYDDIVANQIFNALHLARTSFEIEELLTQWHILQTDALPVIPLARLRTLWAYNSRVKNLSVDTRGSWTGKMNMVEIQVLE